MKKTFIALSLASVFAAPAMANQSVKASELEAAVRDLASQGYTVNEEGYILNEAQQEVGMITEGDGYTTITTRPDENGKYTSTRIDASRSQITHWDEENNETIVDVERDDRNNNVIEGDIAQYAAQIDVNRNEIGHIKVAGEQVQEDVEFLRSVAKGNNQMIQDNIENGKAAYSELVKSGKRLYEAGGREVAKLETSITAVDKGIRMDGQKAYDKLYAAGGREVAKLESVTNALDQKMDLMEKDGAKYVQEKADAAVSKSADKLYAAGGREVAKLETSITAVDKGIRMDGQKAYDKLYAAGGREVAKLESVTNALDQKMGLMEKDGAKYVQEKADAAVSKSADKLYAAGGREVAKLETSITAVDKGIRMDGQKAYDKLYAAGGREVAKLESVTNALDKKMDLMEKDGTKYVQEKADAAVSKSADKLYAAGGREVAKLETSITAVDKGIRMDGQKAYSSLAQAGAREVAKAESALEGVNKSIRVDAEQAGKQIEQQLAAMQARIDELENKNTGGNSKIDDAVKAGEAELAKLRDQASKEVESMRKDAAEEVASIREEIKNGGGASDAKIEQIKIDAAKALDELYKDAGNAGNWAGQVADTAYQDLDGRVNKNTARIDNLESEMKAMGDNMLVLEDRMDGVVASSHAINNARPVLATAGQFGVGVGMGAAGSKKALALGGAYQFNDSWSGSMTVNYETSGKKSKSQVSAGAGVQYRW
ncbi:YadA-like family protein [Vibrio maritimus]|uniref:YadA-like family protein n=1 Tax=Vibrio maritimus TaxID=990268 RepID=UPI001F45A8AE|nr:YadA-like family protein [Vibrio maritimus]